MSISIISFLYFCILFILIFYLYSTVCNDGISESCLVHYSSLQSGNMVQCKTENLVTVTEEVGPVL